uniref:hypothetical protein n=1 Tax=Pseudomonas sp. LM12 TaxID=1449783 RepID=UPI0018689BBB|nr:hypothetical protein [Pseudomonas sp. LM12]
MVQFSDVPASSASSGSRRFLVNVALDRCACHVDDPLAHLGVFASLGEQHPAENDFLTILQGAALVSETGQFVLFCLDLLFQRLCHLPASGGSVVVR